MQTQALYRFHIGLHSPCGRNDAAIVKVRRQLAIDAFTNGPVAFNVTDGQGVWGWNPEPSLVIEVYLDATDAERGRMRAIAQTIRRDLDQDAVGLAVLPVDSFELI